MASNKQFALTPSVSITRTKLVRASQHKTSFNLGDIIPIYVDSDILPGDTVKMDISSLVRMSTPITALMDNLHLDVFAFFVPHRLVWTSWREFMGENTDGAGAVSSEPVWPHVSIVSKNACGVGSIGDYMGLPYLPNRTDAFNVSAIPGRAYGLIWSEFFRDQNIQAPLQVHTGDDTEGLWFDPIQEIEAGYFFNPLKACKDSDYFTRCLPYAQKGEPVTLSIGDSAPVIFPDNSDKAEVKVWHLGSNRYENLSVSGVPSSNPYFEIGTDGNAVALSKVSNDNVNTNFDNELVGGFGSPSHPLIAQLNSHISTDTYADLANATATSINELRLAFAYQRMLEKDALYGTRYWEILKGHFGVTSPDATLQRPEYLGGTRIRINIDQVLSNSGASATTEQELGQVGAVSATGNNSGLFTKSFVEHGTLMILAVARHDQTYGQGVNRMWTRQHRFDYYWPTFANLGAQSVLNKEIFVSDSSSDDDNVFGYQEAWAEYRYKPSIVSGLLNPSKDNSLGYWTLANNFSGTPLLNDDFITQDRNNLARALTTGINGPDFIGDFLMTVVMVRPMPLNSVPGLIDHH